MADVLRGARALVLTAVEEFGIAAVESQAAGRPVIARAGGGALETVIDGVTGCFWSGGPSELAAAVRAFDDAAVDPRRASAGGPVRLARVSARHLGEIAAALDAELSRCAASDVRWPRHAWSAAP